MTALRNQRGTALVAALSIAMILLPLGALVALQSRTDLSIQRNLRSDIETFYVAEAGLAHALAEIPPGRSFEQILAGPDHVAGTSDDGTFPFIGGPPAAFPAPPFRYDVQVTAIGSNLLGLISTGSGVNGGTKVVETLIAQAPLPYTPSALYAETANTNPILGSGFQLSGIDHQAVFPPALQTPPTALLPALCTPDPDAEPTLRAALSGTSPGQLSGAGGTPSVATASRLGLDAYVNAIASLPTAIAHPQGSIDGATWGTQDAPQVSIVTGDLRVTGRLAGTGVLVVRGTFEVSGTIEFSGLVLAQGAVLFASSSSVTVLGTLWQAASQDERLELDGSGVVAYSGSALSDLDRTFPGLLPHAVTVVGWQEEL
jgi:hypothetical protein